MQHNEASALIERAKILNEDVFGEDVMHEAIKEGDEAKLLKLIKILRDSSLSVKDKDYLVWAEHYERYSYIKHLVMVGCRPYISSGNNLSLIDNAIKTNNRKVLVESIIACQKINEILSSDLMGDYSLLAKPLSAMTGKEKAIAISMIVNMKFSDISFYISDIYPVRVYALYNDISLYRLKAQCEHDHIRRVIQKEIDLRASELGKDTYLK